jgi:hypothetical protein
MINWDEDLLNLLASPTRLIIFVIRIHIILFIYCIIIIRWDEDLFHLLATRVDHEAQTRAHNQKELKKRSNPCRVPGCALTGIECVLYMQNKFKTCRQHILYAKHTQRINRYGMCSLYRMCSAD